MSSLLKKYKENVIKNKLEFDPIMYKNLYGSFGIALYRCYALQHNPVENEEIKARIKKIWQKLKRDKILVPYANDTDFVDKMCKIYGYEDFPYGNIAIVHGEHNSLFAPCFFDNEHNKVQILPLREDGVVSATLAFGVPKVIVRDNDDNLLKQEGE